MKNNLHYINFKDSIIKAVVELAIYLGLGLTGGYLVDRFNDNEYNYFIYVFILFAVIGLVRFIISFVKAYKHLKNVKGEDN